MKVLFCGPSLAGETGIGVERLVVRGPARQGDLAVAALEGATAIGLVDGVFETVAAVWHKEILFALSRGIRVVGAASMGALRAAECARYGMIGLGRVYEAYSSGRLVDDAAVAQLHAPPELGSTAITEALVNVEATLDHLAAAGLVTTEEASRLRESARQIFFKERTCDSIANEAKAIAAQRRPWLVHMMRLHRQDIKRADAKLLVRFLNGLPDGLAEPPSDWRFAETPMWRQFISGVTGPVGWAAPSP